MMTAEPPSKDGAILVSLDLWYPECWEIETTERFEVGLLGYGIYTTGASVTTLFTIHADTQATIDSAVESIGDHPHVHEVSEMHPTYRHATTPVPGNAMRDLLVNHDSRKQITNALMSRGFVCAEPIEIRGGREYWTLASNHDRETVQSKLQAVADEKEAEINISRIINSNWQSGANALPTGRLTQRQLEVVRLAQERGYYNYPKETSASALADELGVSTSTLHEHLHKAEATLLGQYEGL